MLHMPSPMLLSGDNGYGAWQVEAARLATGGTKAWSSSTDTTGTFKTTVGAAGGIMFGTPWQGAFFKFGNSDASLSRCVQHAMPNLAVFNGQNGKDIVIRFIEGSVDFLTGINRNGYSSLSEFSDVNPRMRCDLLIRWSEELGKAMQSNPLAGSAETEYTWSA